MAMMLEEGATHVGVATDHVIESFRNDLWEGWKDGSGIDPELKSKFPLPGERRDGVGRVGFHVVGSGRSGSRRRPPWGSGSGGRRYPCRSGGDLHSRQGPR